MVQQKTIKGRVVGGAGKAAYFTQVEWVQAQCREKLGFAPYPGTLNLAVSAEDRLRIESAVLEAGIDLLPPETGFCAARALPLQVGGLAGALVFPAQEVQIHRQEILEVIAPVCLRDALALKDGDEVSLFLGERSRPGCKEGERPGVLLKGRGAEELFALKGIIFDLDGTLIDSIPAYFAMVDEVATRLALPPVPRQAVAEATQDGRFEWSRIFPCTTEGQREELNVRAMAIVREVVPSLFGDKIALLPGVAGFLKAIAWQGVRIGLATSTRRRFLSLKELALKNAGIDGLFHSVITADDCLRMKPAPDPLLACAEAMGVAAGDCLYVGDMRTDIQAGRAAGMTTVGVLTGFDDYRSLESVNPHLIVESVAALEERLILDSSPAVTGAGA